MNRGYRNDSAKLRYASPIDLFRAISLVWSAATASPTDSWTEENPAQNHCSITSLVVQDFFGGDILTTKTAGGTHFYNLIDQRKWDLTIGQFVEPIPLDDTLSSREAALADTTEEKYLLLLKRLNEIG